MKLIFVRHGETNYNVQNLCNEDETVNVFLTDKGKAQAKEAAEKLRHEPIDEIIVSTLKRTRETADLINTHHNAPVSVDARITDRKTGFEGKSVALFKQSIAHDPWHAKPDGGESFEEEKVRVHSFLADLRNRKEKCILVVSHSEIMKIVLAYFNKLSNEEVWAMKIQNCQILTFDL